MDTNNMIPEKKSEPTSISTGMNHTHKRSLMDLPKRLSSIDNKNNQGEDLNSKRSIAVDEGTIHLISLLLLILLFILFSHHIHMKLHDVLRHSALFWKTP
jgi:hypothetical protein